MKTATIGAGVVLLACALGVVWLALQLPASRTADIGPGPMPLLIGAGMAGLALLLIVRTALAPSVPTAAAPEPGQGLAVALAIGAFALYVAAIEVAGIYLPSAVFVLLVFLWLERGKRWLLGLATAAGTCLGIYLLFDLFLQLPLP